MPKKKIELLSPKQNGSVEAGGDRESKKAQTASIKGMWKKAFRSLKKKDSVEEVEKDPKQDPKYSRLSLHRKSLLKRRESRDSEGEAANREIAAASAAKSGEPDDPVYSLLKCAAKLPRGIAEAHTSGIGRYGSLAADERRGEYTQQDSLEKPHSSRSSSPSSGPVVFKQGGHLVPQTSEDRDDKERPFTQGSRYKSPAGKRKGSKHHSESVNIDIGRRVKLQSKHHSKSFDVPQRSQKYPKHPQLSHSMDYNKGDTPKLDPKRIHKNVNTESTLSHSCPDLAIDVFNAPIAILTDIPHPSDSSETSDNERKTDIPDEKLGKRHDSYVANLSHCSNGVDCDYNAKIPSSPEGHYNVQEQNPVTTESLKYPGDTDCNVEMSTVPNLMKNIELTQNTGLAKNLDNFSCDLMKSVIACTPGDGDFETDKSDGQMSTLSNSKLTSYFPCGDVAEGNVPHTAIGLSRVKQIDALQPTRQNSKEISIDNVEPSKLEVMEGQPIYKEKHSPLLNESNESESSVSRYSKCTSGGSSYCLHRELHSPGKWNLSLTNTNLSAGNTDDYPQLSELNLREFESDMYIEPTPRMAMSFTEAMEKFDFENPITLDKSEGETDGDESGSYDNQVMLCLQEHIV